MPRELSLLKHCTLNKLLACTAKHDRFIINTQIFLMPVLSNPLQKLQFVDLHVNFVLILLFHDHQKKNPLHVRAISIKWKQS